MLSLDLLIMSILLNMLLVDSENIIKHVTTELVDNEN